MIRLLKGNLKGSRVTLALYLLWRVADLALRIYVPLLIGKILTDGVAARRADCVMYVVLSAGLICTWYIYQLHMGWGINAVTFRMINGYVLDLTRAPLIRLLKMRRIESLQAVMGMANKLAFYFLLVVPGTVMTLIQTSVVFVILYRMHPVIALACLAFAAVQVLVQYRIQKRMGDSMTVSTRAQNRYRQNMHDILKGMKYAKIHHMEEQVLDSAQTSRLNMLSAMRRYAFWKGMNEASINLFKNMLYLTAVILIAALVSGGSLKIGDYEVIIAYVLIIINAIEDVFQERGENKNTKAVYNVYLESCAEAEEQGAYTAETVSDLRFQDVTFGYQEGEPNISHFSHTLKKGKLYVLKGANGSGKSTLINLLCDLLTPDDGQIDVDGVDLREWNGYDYLERHVAVCDQHTALFYDDIDRNISLSDIPTDVSAYRKAWALDDVEDNPDGTYSGGEQQKIGLARMAYKADHSGAEILILDEPLNHLDRAGKDLVTDYLRRQKDDHLILVIAHDDAFDTLCDEIITLKTA